MDEETGLVKLGGLDNEFSKSVGTSFNSLIIWHCQAAYKHNDVIKWKHFPRYWPFVQGIHRSPVNSPHKGQWRRVLMFSFICAWINGWVSLVIWDAIVLIMMSSVVMLQTQVKESVVTETTIVALGYNEWSCTVIHYIRNSWLGHCSYYIIYYAHIGTYVHTHAPTLWFHTNCRLWLWKSQNYNVWTESGSCLIIQLLSSSQFVWDVSFNG